MLDVVALLPSQPFVDRKAAAMLRRNLLQEMSWFVVVASATALSPTKSKPGFSIEADNAIAPIMTSALPHPKVGMMKQRELFGRQADVDQTVCAAA